MANTPNEAVASIKTKEDALGAIDSLYGTFETEEGKKFLMKTLEDHKYEILNWFPDHVLIELAKKHMQEEWKGYPWK